MPSFLTPLFLQNHAWWKGPKWWYNDKVTSQLKTKCSSQYGGLMIFLSNGCYSHAKSSERPIPPFWVFERPPKIHILNPKKWSFWCWDGFPFQSSGFQFPMFLFWLDHSNILGAHLVKGEIFQCIPKLWWFIPKDSLKEERSFFQNKFWNGRFPGEFDAFKYWLHCG